MNYNGKLVIAIDFDGTIVENKYPKIGELRPGAKRVINKLFDNHHTIIIWTCRCNQHMQHDDLDEAYDFLLVNKIKFHKINKNPNQVFFGCIPKIYYNIVIDDKQIGGLPSWNEIEKIFEKVCVI